MIIMIIPLFLIGLAFVRFFGRQYLEGICNKSAIFYLTIDFRLANTVAHAVNTVGVSMVVNGASVYIVGFAVDSNRQIATVALHPKLTLAT